MRQLLAQDLNIEITAINIKATTTEKLGFAGRKEGIAAHAVTLLKKAG
jgi:2-C-methyl-D-erythritol 2,4-cyclodiphosphate synthase